MSQKGVAMEKQIFLFCKACKKAARVTRGTWVIYETQGEAIRKREQAKIFGLGIEEVLCDPCEKKILEAA